MTSEKDEMVNNLHDIIECGICLKTFVNPKMLPCSHTFCLKCLEEAGNKSQKNPEDQMPCPMCRKLFTIPKNSFSGLPRNFFMCRLISMTKNLKDTRRDTGKVLTKIGSCSACGEDATCENCTAANTNRLECDEEPNQEEEVVQYDGVLKCDQHSSEPLEIYCHNCQTLICYKCLVADHKGHEGDEVNKLTDDFRREIQSDLEQVLSYKVLNEGLMIQSDEHKETFLNGIVKEEQAVLERSKELKDLIDKHTASLLEELSTLKQENVKKMGIVKDESERYQTMLESLEFYCNEVLSKGSPNDICRVRNELHRRTKELDGLLNKINVFSVNVSFRSTDNTESLNHENLVGSLKSEEEKAEPFQKCIIVIGSDQDQSTVSNAMKIDADTPNEISLFHHSIPMTTERREIAMAVKSNMMFATGVGEKADEIWRFHLVFGWTKCGTLITGRTCHTAAFVDDILYICGGYDVANEAVLDSVEAFNSLSRNCAIAGQLVYGAQNASCISYNNSIYVFCGQDRYGATIQHVQVYNTLQNTCTVLSKRLPFPFSPAESWRAVLWETSVILMCRWTCFILDLLTETWQEKKYLQTHVEHFGLALANEQIFILGGGIDTFEEEGKRLWTYHDDIKSLSLTSIKRNCNSHKDVSRRSVNADWWKNVAKLSSPALIHACAVLTLPIGYSFPASAVLCP